MDPSSLLSQLRDAHSPEPIGLWPLAPGWWILLILCLSLLALAIFLGMRYWRSRLWKRQAKREFNAISAQYLKQPSEQQLIALNQLMKRILCSAHNTRDYMHYSEQKWAEALRSVKAKGQSILLDSDVDSLSRGIYCPDTPELDEPAFRRIEQWISKSG